MTEQELINRVKGSLSVNGHLTADLANELLSNYMKLLKSKSKVQKLPREDRVFICNLG